MRTVGAETIFRLGGAKIGENDQDNQIQSITFSNMYFFENGIRSVQWGLE